MSSDALTDKAGQPPGTSGPPTVDRSGGDRIEAFRQDVATMRLRDPAAGRERALFGAGVVGLVAGVVLAVAGYATVQGTSSPLGQRDGLALALVGLTVAIAGAALFLRYSIGRLLRFWLARLTFEQGTQTDRVVDAIERGR